MPSRHTERERETDAIESMPEGERRKKGEGESSGGRERAREEKGEEMVENL